MAKSHKLPFVLSQSKLMKPLDLIHSDLWGPSPVQFVTGVKYFLLFIDDYSRFSWLYLLKTKDKVFPVLLKFKLMVENLLESKIKDFHSDWGVEFRSVSTYLTSQGIHHSRSCPRTPE